MKPEPMNPERWQRLEEIYHAALELDAAERSAFLAVACAGDEALRQEVESLINCDLRAEQFIEAPAVEVAAQLRAESLLETPVKELAAKNIAEDSTTVIIGRTFGHYQILSFLGKGGMGEVYRARDNKLRREVAIKVLPADFSSDSGRLRRFEREARAASALNHPNILTVHEIGEIAGTRFLVTELVEGQTLRRRLADGRLELHEALDVVIQMAGALAAAHAAGVVHRDIKPENVMARPDGLVKVLDFGLAKLTERKSEVEKESREKDDSTLPLSPHPSVPPSTDTGIVLGTPRYMSPEQARGLKVDARTDLWSLGVMLYELVAGRPPFDGATTSDVIAAILTAEPPPLSLPQTSDDLQNIIGKALRKEREERYQSAAEMLGDLKSLRERPAFGSQPSRGSPAKVDRQVIGNFFSRRKTVLLSGALLLALAAIAVMLFTTLFRKLPSASTINRASREFSGGNGIAVGTVWSSDGKFIATTANQNSDYDTYDIWLYPLDGSGDPFPVTKGPGYKFVQDWSPDGRKLLFTRSLNGGGIFVMPALGGLVQKLTSFGIIPRWAPDGSKILFLSHWNHELPMLAKIYLINPDGGGLREFRPEVTHEFAAILWAVWHPDGKRITFIGVHPKSGRGIWTVPVNGGEPVRSESTPEVESRMKSLISGYGIAEWAPSGEYLYLMAHSGVPWSVWRVKVDPRTLRWIDGPDRMTATKIQDYLPRVSPDGKKLGYTVIGEGYERIWTVPFDATKGTLKGDEKLVSPEFSPAYHFDLSADGRKLAYPYRSGLSGELREHSFDTGKVSVMAKVDKYSYNIGAWSADGSRVALRRFVRINPGENRQPEAQYIWMPAGGGEDHPITTPVDPRKARGRCTDWSRDGQWLLEVSNPLQNGKATIRRLPLAAAPQAETQAQEVVSSMERFLDHARFSPDGRWVVFNAWQPKDGKESTLYVVPVNGGAWIPITDGKEWEWNDRPRWSPDGKIIYYISFGAEGIDVWGRRFDPVTGKPVGVAFQVTKHHESDLIRNTLIYKTDSGFGVARDRLVLAMQGGGTAWSTWIMDDVDK